MLLLAVVPALASFVSAAVVKSTAAARPPGEGRPPDAAVSAALGREAAALLSAAAADSDAEARAVVAASWGALGNRAAIPLLTRTLGDAHPDVRIAAAASLYQLGAVGGLTNLIDETRMAGNSPPTTPAQEMRRMARDAARARAVLRLGEIAGETARAALESAQVDPAGEVRDAAAVALARLGFDAAAAPFLDALQDADERARASAARALGLIGREGGPQLGQMAAADAAVAVRAEAVLALGSFSDRASASALAAALKDKSGRVRLAAARALAKRKSPESTAELQALLAEAPPLELSLVAAAGLAERGEGVDLSLCDLTLAQGDPELKSLAVRVLAAARPREALDLLVKVMRSDASRRVRVEAATAVIVRLRRIERAK